MGRVMLPVSLFLFITGCALRPDAPRTALCVPPASSGQDYLAYVHEQPLRPLVCEKGREVYRFISYTYHLGVQLNSFRLEVGADGHATITLRRTDFVLKGTPPLIFDRTRMLTDDELAEFRKVFDASNYWSLPSERDFDPNCVPNGMSLVEVVRDGRYHDRARTCSGDPSMDPVFDLVNKLDRTMK